MADETSDDPEYAAALLAAQQAAEMMRESDGSCTSPRRRRSSGGIPPWLAPKVMVKNASEILQNASAGWQTNEAHLLCDHVSDDVKTPRTPSHTSSDAQTVEPWGEVERLRAECELLRDTVTLLRAELAALQQVPRVLDFEAATTSSTEAEAEAEAESSVMVPLQRAMRVAIISSLHASVSSAHQAGTDGHWVYDVDVRCTGASFRVLKRYSDFTSMHNRLLKHNRLAAGQLPVLPPKRAFHWWQSDYFAERRRAELSTYLAQFLAEASLRRCDELHAFLELGLLLRPVDQAGAVMGQDS